jgi:protocatechuate 3,4-dioxygenase alpha subunit
MSAFIKTASQTIGPFFAVGLGRENGAKLFPDGAAGRRITVSGRVLDGEGKPVADAMLELWQADASGKFASGGHAGSCPGFGRVWTGEDGAFSFETRMPGRVEGQAAHILVTVFARGLLAHLFTRIYFEGEEALDADALLKLAGARRGTLIARKREVSRYEWDLVLQGNGETVFLEV